MADGGVPVHIGDDKGSTATGRKQGKDSGVSLPGCEARLPLNFDGTATVGKNHGGGLLAAWRDPKRG